MTNEIVYLEYVTNRQEIIFSLRSFNENANNFYELARSLLRSTSYWVYDSSSNNFGPSKFVGFKNMAFGKYLRAKKGFWRGARFNGHDTRVSIENIVGEYKAVHNLTLVLVEWGENLLDVDILEGIDINKWKFVLI